VNVGVQYKSKGGIRINPVIRFDNGYPYGGGNLTPVVVNGVALQVPSTDNYTSTVQEPGASPNFAVNYTDPTNPGTVLSPNIYATRGTPERSSPGGELTNPRMHMDFTLEYQIPNTKSTFGVQVTNIFGLVYGEPQINPYYMPIATGVSGYNSGQTAASQDPAYAVFGTSNLVTAQHGNQPYILLPNQAPAQFNFYYQLAL
jgi:hypothetical protein